MAWCERVGGCQFEPFRSVFRRWENIEQNSAQLAHSNANHNMIQIRRARPWTTGPQLHCQQQQQLLLLQLHYGELAAKFSQQLPLPARSSWRLLIREAAGARK
jgi:hypothetical protein